MEIQKLPDDLIGEIYYYLPLQTLRFCNKKYYKIYYFDKINKKKINISYLRYLLRNDMNYIFNFILEINFSLFIKNKKYIYQSKVFPRLIEMVRYLTCFAFESPKCKSITEKQMKKNKLVFKKIKIISNKWTN